MAGEGSICKKQLHGSFMQIIVLQKTDGTAHRSNRKSPKLFRLCRDSRNVSNGLLERRYVRLSVGLYQLHCRSSCELCTLIDWRDSRAWDQRRLARHISDESRKAAD
jgi:hypothetical protein